MYPHAFMFTFMYDHIRTPPKAQSIRFCQGGAYRLRVQAPSRRSCAMVYDYAET